MDDKPDEYIEFMVRYKEWVAIKRMAIYPDTKPEEVVFHLAGIRNALDGRMFKLLGVKTEELDAFATGKTAGIRSGYSSLTQVMQHVDSTEAKAALDKACENKTMLPFAKTYLLNKLIMSLKLDTAISQQAMSKAFPYLKLPKTPGRKPKAKA